MTLQILYQDEFYVAVDKPSGLLVHPSPLAPDEPSALRQLRDKLGRWVYPVHRLDRPTSGVLLFALSPEAAARLCLAFRSRIVDKSYLAVVRGVAADHGVVDSPITEEPGAEPQTALTEYRRLAEAELSVPVGRYATARYSLVDVRPHTGRRHQIRRHFAHLRHPIVGDTAHGDGRHNRLFRERFGLWRLLLFATAVSFVHPWTARQVTVSAPLPPDVATLFAGLGWGAACSSSGQAAG